MKKTFLFVCILFSVSAFCGETKSGNSPVSTLAPLMEDGNKLLSKGQFSAAMAVWQKVLESEPDNANANFKMGMCYYNSLDESPKALPYLKKASKKITDKYDFFSTAEKNAPYDALYFLGETYLASNQPDSALWMFFQYEDKFDGNPPIPVDRQIRNCINAKNAVKNPRDVTMKNPGKNVNSSYAETNPVLTIDNSVMFFASRRAVKDANKQISNVNGKFDSDIYYTRKDAKGNWDTPVPFKWNSDKDETPLYISADGLTLYFSKETKGQSDVYTSSYLDKVWSSPKAVSEINSGANETGVSVSADGKYLYFCSDREGGTGRFDIYQCVKSGAKWGAPKNLGTALNTGFSETSPYINPNGKTLFFASNGYRDGMGGYDIFFSELKDDGAWTTPQNMGFPINTTRDDIDFYITGGGTRYYATVREEDDSYDIFKIEGGGFSVENIDVTGQVVTLTQEMTVADVVEVQTTVEKEVEVVETIETTVEIIKEVEKVDLEKEQKLIDSLMAVARAEAKLDPAVVQAQAEKAKAEAEKAKAESDKAMAEAELKRAEADKVKAEAAIARAHADSAHAMMRKAVADSVIARAEIKKAEAEKAKAEHAAAKIFRKKAKQKAAVAAADQAKAEVEKANAEKLRAEAEATARAEEARKAEAEAKVAEAKKAIADAELAGAEKAKADAQRAEAEKAKAEAEAKTKTAQIELDKAAAEKARHDAVIASAQKSKEDAAKAKSEAEAALAEKAKAAEEAKARKYAADQAAAESSKASAEKNKEELRLRSEQVAAEKIKAEAAKADAAAKIAQANADAKTADAEKLKAQADIANSAKAQADAAKADAIAKTAQAVADKATAEAAVKKATADIAAAEKSKAEAAKAEADTQKAKAIADKALADAEKARAIADAKKTDLEKIKAELELKKQQNAGNGGAKPNPNEQK